MPKVKTHDEIIRSQRRLIAKARRDFIAAITPVITHTDHFGSDVKRAIGWISGGLEDIIDELYDDRMMAPRSADSHEGQTIGGELIHPTTHS